MKAELHGRAEKTGFDRSTVIPEEWARGLEIEKEHGDELPLREAISADHLSESARYYTALDLMEKFLDGIEHLPKEKQDALFKGLDTQIGILLRSSETMGKILDLGLFTTAAKR